MKYNDFSRVFIGDSDIGALIVAGGDMKPQYLNFGEDGKYTAYVITGGAGVEIGSHYRHILTACGYVKIYDDEGLTFSAHAEKINIYRAGEFGCIVELTNPDRETAKRFFS